MIFNTFDEKDKPIFILIHGVWMPWQCWQPYINELQKKFYVVAMALDAHVENEVSNFISIGDEATKIVSWFVTNSITEVFAIYGSSMGGAISYRVACDDRVSVKNLILDGAPLVPTPPLVKSFMKWKYCHLLHQLQNRKQRSLIGVEKNFLPKEFFSPFLKFADTMNDSSVRNMMDSVGEGQLEYNIKSTSMRMLYLHGTRGNEILSIRTAKILQNRYPTVKVMKFRGYVHGELLISHYSECMHTIEQFLKSK